MNATRKCSVAGCDSSHYCKGFCVKHYQRMRRGLDVLVDPPKPHSEVCIFDGCGERAVTLNRTLCSSHYAQHKKGKDLTTVKPVRKSRGICIIDGCDNRDNGAHGLCVKHHGRLRRQGNPLRTIPQIERNLPRGANHPKWNDETCTYDAAHQRIRKLLGRASNRACVDCQRTARQWSYGHNDPAERQSDLGPYSLDPSCYFPRCVSCHKRFDLAHIKAARSE